MFNQFSEHLAPDALVTPTGETYAMVAPTITKDIFILMDNQENVMRMDVGNTEEHRIPFVVQNIVEDGGTRWYVGIWYWLSAKFLATRFIVIQVNSYIFVAVNKITRNKCFI